MMHDRENSTHPMPRRFHFRAAVAVGCLVET